MEEIRNAAKLQDEIRSVINRYSAENGSNTPDFILAEYLLDCLKIFNKTVTQREAWYGRIPEPVEPPTGLEAPVNYSTFIPKSLSNSKKD